jgi:hypothetical protein
MIIGLFVVLDVTAAHRGIVGGRVIPVGAADTQRAVGIVAEHHQHRYAVGPRIVDCHRCVLQTDGVVDHDRHRLARRFRVAVSQRSGDLFVRGGYPLDLADGMVDHRLL